MLEGKCHSISMSQPRGVFFAHGHVQKRNTASYHKLGHLGGFLSCLFFKYRGICGSHNGIGEFTSLVGHDAVYIGLLIPIFFEEITVSKFRVDGSKM